ncbi:MAG TPA: homocysteine S-methyltransferase family protein [Burkholderiales bacterium]
MQSKETFLQRLARAHQRPMLADSATGTWFQDHVKDEAGTCCDGYNLTKPDEVRRMYRDKLEAGAELMLTNTFNSCVLRLPEFGLDVADADRLNAEGVRLLRQAMGDTGRHCFIGGDVGPTGLIIGDTGTYPEIRANFVRQIRALVQAGVDVICVETLLQALEGQAAAEAAHEVFAKEGVKVPLYMTVVFTDLAPGQSEHRTFFGDSVEEMLEGKDDALAGQRFEGLLKLGADVVGANCSVGLGDVIPIATRFRQHIDAKGLTGKVFVAAKPNSVVMSNQSYEGPDVAAERLPELVRSGAHIIGYCCGSLPEHIRVTAEGLDALTARR